ncbi:hypothetical protein CIB48_g10680 [Xylaria polymorpha]|nr:hypothetical protein CIB48_g10680 [Xylaria polymorpha]
MALFSVTRLPYMIYAQRCTASIVGLSEQQANDALEGRVPQHLSEEEVTAYQVGRPLALLSGPLDDATWKEFSGKMEKSQIVAIANLIGGYKWMALLIQLNGEDLRRKDSSAPVEV